MWCVAVSKKMPTTWQPMVMRCAFGRQSSHICESKQAQISLIPHYFSIFPLPWCVDVYYVSGTDNIEIRHS